MNLNNLSDKIVFNILRNVRFGYLELVNHNGKIYKFGDPKNDLKANIKIKNPNFTFNLIKGGSVGFAESYMKNDFVTDDLSNLIEFTARNINLVHRFSGILDFPFINFVKTLKIP